MMRGNINPFTLKAYAQSHDSDKTDLDDVSSQTSGSNEKETGNEYLPGPSILGKTDYESGQEKNVSKAINVQDEHNSGMKQEKEVETKSEESFHGQAAILKEARGSDFTAARQSAETMVNEEEVIKIIKKAKCKDFKCRICSKTFVNNYCLSVHACKSISRNKLTKGRINCDICHKSYANKYLHAGHSCKPTKTIKTWQKPKLKSESQGKTAKQITDDVKKSEKIKSRDKDARSNVGGISNVSPLGTRKAKGNKKNDKNMMSYSQCIDRKLNNPLKKATSENVLYVKQDNIIADSIETSGKKNDFKNMNDEECAGTVKVVGGTKASSGAKEALVCEVCGRIYKNKTNLKKHSCKPPSVDTRTCNICNKTFNLKVHLQIHKRIHTKECPFLCISCGKLFNQRANLMKHMRTHEPLKKFQCEICKWRFTQKAALTEHLIVHTSVKAYTCVKCGKGFRHKHGLQNHLKRKFPCDLKHKKETESQDECLKELKSDHCEAMTGGKARMIASSQIQNDNANLRSKHKHFIQKDCHGLEKHCKDDVLPEIEKVVGIETPMLKSHEAQSESSVKNVQIKDRVERLGSINDTVKLKDTDSSENHLVRSCLFEERQVQNCELFMQQPQARYIASYQDLTGWIPLDYKLADL